MTNRPCCFVPGCANSEGNKTNATFHGFPEELQEEWLIAIGRNRDTFILDELVCSEHFKDTDFEYYDSVKMLQPHVIPSLNLPSDPDESHLTVKSQLNTSSCENIEEFVQKYNSYEKSKPVKILSNAVCTILKPDTDNTFKCETTPLSSINVILVSEDSQKGFNNFSIVNESELSDPESGDEYCLNYEDILNCRTCLSEIGSDGGYIITDVHHESKTLKEMIVYCIPQMASTLLDTDQVCGACLESIKFCTVFIENCLKVEAEFMENQDTYIAESLDVVEDYKENDVPELVKHISLDHNYLPETDLEVCEQPHEETIQKALEDTTTYYSSQDKHECLKCSRTFKTKNYLLDHIRRIHRNGGRSESKKKKMSIFECDFCEKSFLTKWGYELHLQLSHRDQVEMKKESGGYTSKDYDNQFGGLSEHICKICSLRFDTRTELNVHNEIHPNSHLCHVCGNGFGNKAKLKVHMLTHNDRNTHLCHKCGQGFKSETLLSLHFKHHEPHSTFQCDQCPSAFQQRYRLDQHKKVRHLGTREYKCMACDKMFCYKANLKSHYKLKHSEVKPFQCERCGLRFARSDYLRRHTNCEEKSKLRSFASYKRKYRYKRGDPVLITCKLCDKVFKDVQMLRLHVKTHTKLRKYKCRSCNLTFTTSGNRDRHERVHEDASFRCEVCFKRMETQEALDEHCVMSHENSKKYKCHVCGALFGRKYLLHSHVAERHEDVEDFEKEKDVLYKVVMEDYLIDE